MPQPYSRHLLSPLTFLAVVVATNALTATLGVVTWVGVAATAGTWLAGFAFVAIATVWMRHQTRLNYRCPCGRTFELRAEALHHERLVHRRPARLSQIEKLP